MSDVADESGAIRSSSGIESSKGIQASSGIEGGVGAQAKFDAARSELADKMLQRHHAQLSASFQTGFKKKTGYNLRITPDDAGKIHYGSSEIVIEIYPIKQQGGAGLPQATEPKTFFTTTADAGGVSRVYVTAGAINSEVQVAAFYTVADGDSAWIKNIWDTDGVTVLSTTVGVGASLPDGDAVTSYKLLATVAVAAGVTTVTPLGWNFTDAQACGVDGDGAIIVNYN